MTRLFKPMPGEVVDRQTILTLKIEHCYAESSEESPKMVSGGSVIVREIAGTKVNVHPFVDELEMIRKHMLENWIPTIQNDEEKTSAYDDLYDSLYDVNSQLWELEDKARTLRSFPHAMSNTQKTELLESAWDTLLQITSLNDQRADIVKKINGLWGYDTQEKLY